MAVGTTKQRFNQALTFFHNGEYEKAISYFLEVVEEDRKNTEAFYNLACCYSMTGNVDGAIRYLKKAIKINPNCQDWAKEDHEFQLLRKNTNFQQLIYGVYQDDEDDIDDNEDSTYNLHEDEETTRFVDDIQSNVESDGGYGLDVPPIPTQPRSVHKPSSKSSIEPPPPLTDRSKKTIFEQPPENHLPPCPRCDGIVLEETRSRYSPLMTLLTVYLGMVIAFFMFLTIWGIVGIPVVFLGLYWFSKMEAVWICQNCGAAGKHAGQPADDPHRENLLRF